MAETPLPCPFCGCDPVVETEMLVGHPYPPGEESVHCPGVLIAHGFPDQSCGAHATGIAAWNRRAPTEGAGILAARVEDLLAENAALRRELAKAHPNSEPAWSPPESRATGYRCIALVEMEWDRDRWGRDGLAWRRPEEFMPYEIADGAPGTHGFLPLPQEAPT